MTTRCDDDPEFGPDDPLLVVLRPGGDRLSPSPGRYEAVRRAAARRRLFRTAAGAAVACAAAVLVALPLHRSVESPATRPVVPLAPPPATGPADPSPSPSDLIVAPSEADPRPTPSLSASQAPTPFPGLPVPAATEPATESLGPRPER
ncbi:hypothetical protein [Streptomyces tagetis]|uniref:Uncharacterized protein n=1 Tax=Streptomyces tagetis TaxID=2820809 RepID=A0A940XC18_9ACTN|nr:hypothetical protein [Streptomyces sp. RG38]MBQ0827538.1 hypothetical protein [Streptomyces sp. RG38]